MQGQAFSYVEVRGRELGFWEFDASGEREAERFLTANGPFDSAPAFASALERHSNALQQIFFHDRLSEKANRSRDQRPFALVGKS